MLRKTLFRIASLLLVCTAASAASDVSTPSPLHVTADLGQDGLLVLLDAAEVADLADRDTVHLHDVPWPGGPAVELDLERVHVLVNESVFRLDGRAMPARELAGDVQMWAGHVVGEDNSDVYLAFSPSGARGWILRGDSQAHLLSIGADGAPGQRMVTSARLAELEWSGAFQCGANNVRGPGPQLLTPPPGPSSHDARAASFSAPSTPPPILECRIAIETDTQYTAQFPGGYPEAADYLVSLMGAVSARYREQIGIVFTLVYGVFYLGPDPWTSQESGGDGFDLIFEFMDAWEAGNAPVEADIFYFMSGSNLLPSLGAFEGLCSPDWAFATGVGFDGTAPFPITQGPLTWNYTVLAHEIGHVFGASHTHEYCPPIDQCAGFGFGPCQTQQICQTDGTVMSYCVQCPGEAANYTTSFHPFIVDVIRGFAENHTCLQPFLGTMSHDLGSALAGSSGTPQLDVDFDDGAHQLTMEFKSAPASSSATIVVGISELSASFKGGTLVPDPLLLLDVATPAQSDYTIVADVPTNPSLPDGIEFLLQTWFVDAGGPAGLSATNGVLVELIIPDPLPPTAWIPHPSNGHEYALSHVGTYAAARLQALDAGGDLASVDSQALNDWLVSTFADGGTTRSVYLGLSDAGSEGTFTWEDNTALGFTAWGAQQPNDNSASGQDHAELLLRDQVLTHEDNDPLLQAGEWNDSLGTGWFSNRGVMERVIGSG